MGLLPRPEGQWLHAHAPTASITDRIEVLALPDGPGTKAFEDFTGGTRQVTVDLPALVAVNTLGSWRLTPVAGKGGAPRATDQVSVRVSIR